MDLQTIPELPGPLTFEQAEAMAQRQIKKHHVAIILLHWFNATVWLTELATGAACEGHADWTNTRRRNVRKVCTRPHK